jgi:TonB family protein
MITVASNVFREAMLVAGGSMAASIVAKATITTAFGLIGAWLARRSRAAFRHVLLSAAFGVLLVLPIVSMVAPPVRIAISAAAGERIAPTAQAASILPADSISGAPPALPRASAHSISSLLLLGWIAGVSFFLAPLAAGLWQVRSFRRFSIPWRHGQLVAEGLAREAGIRRRVEVLLHRGAPGPMTCGVVHPAIVLSQDAERWSEEDLNRAIVHELEHVRRGDWVVHCAARAVCAVYWFHPLVWIAWRRLALDAERSCDDVVLGRSEAPAYADQLVSLAKRLSMAPVSSIVAMASRADLAARVRAVLDTRQRRGRAGRFAVGVAYLAALLFVVTTSPLRVIAAPQTVVSSAVRFSVNNFLVIEDVIVSDKEGRDVEGLRPSDFTIVEDGVPQTINLFEFQKVADSSTGARSYYILGYYTTNGSFDGKLRHVTLSGNENRMAKLGYRAGYTPRPPGRPVIDRDDQSVESGITPPKLLRKQEPEYSEKARKAKWQGTVLLSVEVDAVGQVAGTRMIRSLGMGLDQKAIEAVRQWRFKPGMKDGMPVSVSVQVEVNFRLL